MDNLNNKISKPGGIFEEVSRKVTRFSCRLSFVVVVVVLFAEHLLMV